MSDVPFEHRMAAHCESGAMSALLKARGLDVSEPMVFGISGGLFFGYLRSSMFPFPTFVLRSRPGEIRSKAARRLGAGFSTRRFRNTRKGMQALDDLLARGIPVGLQVDFFYMDYIPEYARAHFNAHHVIAVAKEDDHYVLSDSYHPTLARLRLDALERARFAGGLFAPRGLIFYPERVPETVDLDRAVRRGIREVVFRMLRMPVPFFGVSGIGYFSRKLAEWPRYARDTDHLSHEIMTISVILEERGTGGGGFRFLYASFLQEAASLLGNSELGEMAEAMMADGDAWREISLFAARMGKQRDMGPERLRELADMVAKRAAAERDIFTRLSRAIK